MTKTDNAKIQSPHHTVVAQSTFLSMLAAHWQSALDSQQPLSLFLIDIDYFNNLSNKNSIAQQVITAISQLFHRQNDALSHFNRNKILLLTTELSFKETGQMAERIHGAVRALAIVDSNNPAGLVTVSIGHNTPDPEDDFGALDLLAETLRHNLSARQNGGNVSHTRLYSRILK